MAETIKNTEEKKDGIQTEQEKLESVKRADAAVKSMHDFTSPEVLYRELINSVLKYHPSTDISMIEKAYKDKNIHKLKLFFLSVNEMVMDLDDVLKRELNEKLQQCCGRDLNVYDRKLHNKVENIINRGKIRSDNEYRQVKLYLDCLNPEDKNIQLIDLLDTLMSEYEMLKRK